MESNKHQLEQPEANRAAETADPGRVNAAVDALAIRQPELLWKFCSFNEQALVKLMEKWPGFEKSWIPYCVYQQGSHTDEELLDAAAIMLAFRLIQSRFPYRDVTAVHRDVVDVLLLFFGEDPNFWDWMCRDFHEYLAGP